jgi:allantoicase
MEFTEYPDLASERLGGRVVAANDDFFAPKENLIKAAAPIFIEDKFTDRGKWMDGWETRRRRTPGFDWCILQLGLAGRIRAVVVDTSFFRGNFPEHASLEVCSIAGESPQPLLDSGVVQWTEILPKSPLRGDAKIVFPIEAPGRVTHLRLKIYPDGGIARLRVHGEVLPDWETSSHARELDLAALSSGGLVVASSDVFFGSAQNLILPGPSLGMHDGWETRRRRGPGHDWAVIRLGGRGEIHRVEVDTAYFRGNFPESCSLDACAAPYEFAGEAALAQLPWREILPRSPLRADATHVFEKELHPPGYATHLRLNIFPDGGVARLRAFGTLAAK